MDSYTFHGQPSVDVQDRYGSGRDSTTDFMVCYTQQEDSAVPVGKTLRGPNTTHLEVQGYVECCLRKEDKTIREKVYVVRKLGQPLLDRPAIERLKLLSRVESVATNTETGRIPIETQYRDVFTGLGSFQEEHHIRLKEDAVPFAVTTPGKMAIPLFPKDKEELSRMGSRGVVSKVATARIGVRLL